VGAVRWLRVNTLKWSVEDAVEWFESERWEMMDDVEQMIEVAYVALPLFMEGGEES
jgi:putative methyltransferase